MPPLPLSQPRVQPVRIILLAGVAYVVTSSCLVLFNKHALSSFNFGCPNTLLLFHCALSVFLVKSCEALGFLKDPIEPLKWEIIKLWFPVNLLFVGMLVSSFFALKLIGVGMFTVLKNLSNFLTIGGDYFFFGRSYGWPVWTCIFLMLASALASGMTDLRFTWSGYIWQLINCLFTSGYALYLNRVMERVKEHTHDRQRMGEFSMVYYNNLLSLGPIAVLVLGFGEVSKLPQETALLDPEFLLVALLGGLLGFAISFTSLWFMSRSTATVYSLTGSLNKVLVAVAGIILFREVTTVRNLTSIAVGLLAGVIFVFAKAYQPAPSKH
ncbi:hypothetical protein V8C86DRAFT_2507702 [Haematococcus lacustris]